MDTPAQGPVVTPQQPVSVEQAQPKKKSRVLVVGIVFVLFLLLLLVVGFISSAQKSAPQEAKKTAQASPVKKIKPAPRVSFATYVNTAPLPSTVTAQNIYELKNNFSKEEIGSFAAKLGITTTLQTSGKTVLMIRSRAEYWIFNPLRAHLLIKGLGQ
jgi:Na+-transporting methylmalonyl-CoA/oxaloacetate decarboxylase gamma subunit